MAHVHCVTRRQASGCQLQRPVLRHRAALPDAPLRHHLHRSLSLEDEPNAGLYHVRTVLCVPRPQRHAGGPHPHLPRFDLSARVQTEKERAKGEAQRHNTAARDLGRATRINTVRRIFFFLDSKNQT